MTGVAWWVPWALAFIATVFFGAVAVLLYCAVRFVVGLVGAWRRVPAHAGAVLAPERFWPWDTDPRYGSMQLEEDRRIMLPRLGASIGGSYDAEGRWIEHWHQDSPDAPREYDDVSELEPVEMPDWMQRAAREVAHDWRDQTARDLAPATLDPGPGVEVASLAPPGPDCPYCLGTGWITVPDDDGESAYETACPMCDPEPGAPLVKRKTAEPDPEPPGLTVAGRLIETSDEWLRRLTANAAPGWTYAAA